MLGVRTFGDPVVICYKMLDGSTVWTNLCNVLRATMLQHVALKSCVHLAGPFSPHFM